MSDNPNVVRRTDIDGVAHRVGPGPFVPACIDRLDPPPDANFILAASPPNVEEELCQHPECFGDDADATE